MIDTLWIPISMNKLFHLRVLASEIQQIFQPKNDHQLLEGKFSMNKNPSTFLFAKGCKQLIRLSYCIIQFPTGTNNYLQLIYILKSKNGHLN